MLKKILALCLLFAWFTSASAAVDVNTATEAQLQALKGIGPATGHAIVQERSDHGPYKSEQDLSSRVKGLGPKSLAKLEQQGLTIPNGAAHASSDKSSSSGKGSRKK